MRSMVHANDNYGVVSVSDSGAKKPLPGIKGLRDDAPDFISYTISAGSGRATAVFSQADEGKCIVDTL